MEKNEAVNYLKNITRSITDYPRKGILFRDLTTIFQDTEAMGMALEQLTGLLYDVNSGMVSFDKIVGIEARGFLLAGAISGKLGGGVVMMRKPGKLPYKKRRIDYELEYGKDALEVHEDAINPGDNIIVVDDLLATGGTAEAGCKLVEELGGKILKVLFLVELPDLEGRKKLAKYSVESVLCFEGA